MLAKLINTIVLLSKNILYFEYVRWWFAFAFYRRWFIYLRFNEIQSCSKPLRKSFMMKMFIPLRESIVFFNLNLFIDIRWMQEKFNTFGRSLSKFLQNNFKRCFGDAHK